MEWTKTMMLLPLQLAWSTVLLPGHAIGGVIAYVEGYIRQKIRREMKTAGRGEVRVGTGNEKRRTQNKGSKKSS